MTDREKIIKGLRQHVDGSMYDRCGECPYYGFDKDGFSCRDELLSDTLALLEERGPAEALIPRVMPLANVIEWMGEIDGLRDPVYWENRREQYESQWMFEAKNPLYMIEAIKKGVARVWTWKPTEEQSKAVKWDE